MLLLGNLLLNFENQSLLIALGVSATITAVCFLALACNFMFKRCSWFKPPPADDEDLVEKVEEETTSKKKKKKKNICRRIWQWCTGKSAYEDMIRKIKKRSTETHIDTVIEWEPEKAPPIQEVNQNESADKRGRRG